MAEETKKVTEGWRKYAIRFPDRDVQTEMEECQIPPQLYERYFEVSGVDDNGNTLLLCETDARIGKMLLLCAERNTPISLSTFLDELYKTPERMGGFYVYNCPNGEMVVSKDPVKFVKMVRNKPIVGY